MKHVMIKLIMGALIVSTNAQVCAKFGDSISAKLSNYISTKNKDYVAAAALGAAQGGMASMLLNPKLFIPKKARSTEWGFGAIESEEPIARSSESSSALLASGASRHPRPHFGGSSRIGLGMGTLMISDKIMLEDLITFGPETLNSEKAVAIVEHAQRLRTIQRTVALTVFLGRVFAMANRAQPRYR